MTLEERVEEYIEKNCKMWEEGELTVDEIVRLAIIGFTKELEKENAELKRDKEDLIFIRNQNAKCMCEDKELLTKAKELLNEFLDFESSCIERGMKIPDKIRAEAEQFLKE